MANNNQIYKMSNAGGFKSLTRYYDMLAGNTTWSPWEPQGAYDALATTTLTATASSVTFAGIPAGYKHLQLRISAQETRSTYGIADAIVQFNSDSTTGNYKSHEIYGDGSAATATSTSITYGCLIADGTFGTNTGGTFGAGVVDILDYANTSKNKTIRALTGVDINGTIAGYGGRVGLFSGLWISTAAITSITILPISGTDFRQYSSFALFGVK